MKISNIPPKGTADWFPEEFKIRKYIFDKWRSVCVKYGYKEYLTPILESADVYRAKSGEDIGGKELMILTDRAGRELAIRPEMTPSVTRMMTRIYDAETKPIRYFSIANFFRNENPQRGRNREFWQLNADIFGSESLNSDLEILMLSLDIMLSFNPPKGSFTVFVNNRKLIDYVFSEICNINSDLKTDVIRTMDKFEKLSKEDFSKKLSDSGLSQEDIENLNRFLNSKTEDELLSNFPQLKDQVSFQDVTNLLNDLRDLGYGEWISFKPNVIRGFDYYDGMVFEVFDNAPENNRSMFGGGRYNGLAGIFGSNSFPAVGFAPGDETMRIFLESWKMDEDIVNTKEEKYFVPILNKNLKKETLMIAEKIRQEGKIAETGLEEMGMGKALTLANKKAYDYVCIFNDDEKQKGIYKVKNMQSGEEQEYGL